MPPEPSKGSLASEEGEQQRMTATTTRLQPPKLPPRRSLWDNSALLNLRNATTLSQPAAAAVGIGTSLADSSDTSATADAVSGAEGDTDEAVTERTPEELEEERRVFAQAQVHAAFEKGLDPLGTL
jgi:hypothetical protein